MFTNRAGCTIYEKTVQNRAPTFVRHDVGAVYWEDTKEQEGGADRSPQNKAFVSIPVSSIDYNPKAGDKIIGSIIADTQPPANAMTVMSVSDFRYGSAFVQHIEVNAE